MLIWLNVWLLLRLKDVAQEQYSQKEAERAAGMTKEVLAPAHGAAMAMA
jgi:hypothetical protein